METWRSLLKNFYWIIQIIGVGVLIAAVYYAWKVKVKKYRSFYIIEAVILFSLNGFFVYSHFIG
ncbi:hypothetical protein ACONJN_002948 [Listeria monocytogenes]